MAKDLSLNMSDKNHLRELISIKNRRLQELQKKQALYGISVDPQVFIEIQDTQAEIEQLQIDLISEERKQIKLAQSRQIELQPFSQEILTPVVEHLNEYVCWYILKAANKALTWNDHERILAKEMDLLIDAEQDFLAINRMFVTGYLNSLLSNYLNLLFIVRGLSEERIVLGTSPEVLKLLGQKLQIQ